MAEPLWKPDGTQPPPPPEAWEDPVSGLVTGAAYKAEPFEVDVAEPVMPDLSEVRRAVDAVLSAEDELNAPIVPAQRSKSPRLPEQTPGMMPPNPRPGWPRSPSVRQLPGLRARPPDAKNPVARAPRPADRQRPKGSTAGFTGLFALIIITLVIIVTAIGSLVNTITSLFH